MQWVDVHLNGSLWEELFTAAWWANMRRFLMRKGENSPAFLSPPGHSSSLWRSLCPLFIWLPDASASGAGDPEASPSTRHRYDKTFLTGTLWSWESLRLFQRENVPRMWTKETRSNRDRCCSYFSRKELKFPIRIGNGQGCSYCWEGR